MNDIYKKLDNDGAAYFKEDREKMMGTSLEDLEKGREVSPHFSFDCYKQYSLSSDRR